MTAPPPLHPQLFPPAASGGLPNGLPPPPLPPPIVPPSSLSSSSSITTLSKLNATTVILTHIPPFLRHPKNLRDLLYYSTSTTPIKHLFYSCPIKRYANDVNVKQDSNDKVVAVIKFTHTGNALSISRNWKFVQQKLNQQLKESEATNDSDDNNNNMSYCKMNAFLLYSDTSNNLTQLHPEKSKVDANFIESIWELIHKERDNNTDAGKVAQQADLNMIHSLVESYRMIERRQKELDDAAIQSGTTPGSSDTTGTDFDASTNEEKEGNDGTADSTFKLDSAKLRAAAGGGAYDEENDPLNAPEVLEAVKQFKKRLEITQGGFRRKRKEYVDKRLEDMVKTIKEKLKEQRRIEKEEREKLSLLPPPPPLPTGMVPPPPSLMNVLPPPPLPPADGPLLPGDSSVAIVPNSSRSDNIPSRDTGKRGVSNLPAWMTAAANDNSEGKKRSLDEVTSNNNDDSGENSNNEPIRKKTFIPSEANRDINMRKERIEVNEGTTSLAAIRAANEAADKKAKQEQEKVQQYYKEASSFTNEQILQGKYPKIYLSEKIPSIRQFVKDQMVEYLGEEEATLIDFVMNYIVKCNSDGSSSDAGKGNTVQGLLGEMEVVLDEDAESFVIDLFKKIIDV